MVLKPERLKRHQQSCRVNRGGNVNARLPGPAWFSSVEDRLAYRTAQAGTLNGQTSYEVAQEKFKEIRIQFGNRSMEELVKKKAVSTYPGFSFRRGDGL